MCTPSSVTPCFRCLSGSGGGCGREWGREWGRECGRVWEGVGVGEGVWEGVRLHILIQTDRRMDGWMDRPHRQGIIHIFTAWGVNAKHEVCLSQVLSAIYLLMIHQPGALLRVSWKFWREREKERERVGRGEVN